MIATVVGKINGVDVVFSPFDERREDWRLSMPSLPQGSHTVELWLTDAAGNKTYFATLLVEVDFLGLVTKITVLDYSATIITKDFKIKMMTEGGARV
jgi:hypothetical protein